VPKKVDEKKSIWDHLEKLKWPLGIAATMFVSIADKWEKNTDRLNKIEISIAEIKISLNNVVEKIH